MNSTNTETANGVVSTALFGILLPDGRRIGGMTRRQVIDCLPWMPVGAIPDPQLPSGNPVALNLLDALCR